jgi:hypothetical protein
VEEVPFPVSSKGKEVELQPVKGGTLTDISEICATGTVQILIT